MKYLSGNWKIAFGNIEHWHGDERCRFCVVKDYPWVFLGIKVSKMCCKETVKPVIGLGDVQKCTVNMKIESLVNKKFLWKHRLT